MTEVKEPINTGCFLLILLTFLSPLRTFGQEPLAVEDVNAMRLQAAESDAKKDADNDMKRSVPFFTGMGSAFAGVMCLGLTERTLRTSPSDSSIQSLGCCALIAAGSAPFAFALVKHHNDPPDPPIERLIGKHPEYVRAYIDAYEYEMWEVMGVDKSLVEKWIESTCSHVHTEVILETVAWDYIAPWQATYWKQLDGAHRVRFHGQEDTREYSSPPSSVNYFDYGWYAWR